MKLCQLFIHESESMPSFPGAGLGEGWEAALIVREVVWWEALGRHIWGIHLGKVRQREGGSENQHKVLDHLPGQASA